MHFIIHKVKSLPLLSKKEDPPPPEKHFCFLSPWEVEEQTDEIEELIGAIFEESNNHMVLINLWNKFPKDRNIPIPHVFSLVPSEALTLCPPC